MSAPQESPSGETQETQQTQLTPYTGEEIQIEEDDECWGQLIPLQGWGTEALRLVKDKYLIGRDKTDDLCFPLSSVSRSHIEIYLEQGTRSSQPMIRDRKSTNGTLRSGTLLTPNRPYPLLHNDRIRLAAEDPEPMPEFLFVSKHARTKQPGVDSLLPVAPGGDPALEHEILLQKYQVLADLGGGSASRVKLALQRETGELVAIKLVANKTADLSCVEQLKQEAEILQQLKHDHIIQCIEMIDSPHWIYLVLEYAEGGDLQQYAVKHPQGLSVCTARIAFRQVMKALCCLHEQGIVHRDLKPDNILRFPDQRGDEDEIGTLKLSDFGVSASLESKPLRTICGTPQYMAPEIQHPLDTISDDESVYGPAVDIWSAGVLLHVLLCGTFPVADSPTQLVTTMIGDENVEDLLTQLLQRSPNLRPSAVEVLKHPWLQSQKLGKRHSFDSSPPSHQEKRIRID